MQYLKLLILLLASVTTFSQIPWFIQVNASLKEHTSSNHISFNNYSSFISENNILYSFLFDTDYYWWPQRNIASFITSSDYGETWSSVKEVPTSFSTKLNYYPNNRINLIQLSDGSFLGTSLTTEQVVIIFKSDNLEVFDSVTTIAGQRVKPDISQSSSGTIYLTYYAGTRTIKLRKSNDGGKTWSNELGVTLNAIKNFSTTIQEIQNNHLITVFCRLVNNEYQLLTVESFDDGITWQNEKIVLSDTTSFKSQYISKSEDGKLWLTFQQTAKTNIFKESQEEIYYLSSSDNGNQWSEKKKFTKFLGNDRIIDVTNTKNGPLITMESNRIFSTVNTVHLGIVGTSQDPSPPVILGIDHENFSLGSDNVIKVKTEDDDKISRVTLQVNKLNYTMYDDGLHGDEAAYDNIYGNTISDFKFADLTTESICDINNITLPFNNAGILADLYVEVDINATAIDNDSNAVTYNSTQRVVESLGRYDDIGFLFSGGFYLSGYSNDSLWVNGAATASLVNDYVPGNVGSLTDHPDNIIYPVFESDTPFGQTWQDWRTAVEQGAYFYDGDDDGIYDPVDKNSNGQWDANEDKPDLLYDASFFTCYNDGLPANQRRYNTVDPVGIEVRQTIFASSKNSILDDVIFIRYSLLYKGLGLPSEPDSLSDVIFSVWSDSDIGDAVDDLVGCDTLLNSGYTYNYPQSDDYYFGPNAPAVFKTFVQGPLIKSRNPADVAYNKMGPELGVELFPGYKNGEFKSFIHFQGGDPDLRDPDNAVEFRNYAHGTLRTGLPADPCSWAYGQVVGGVNCNEINPYKWYSGDPVTSYGWLNTVATDQRDLVNTDKFTLIKNEPMDIIIAYVVARGTDALNSITRTREITEYVHEEYQRNFSTIVSVEDEPEELINKFSLSQNYPNPFNPTTTIKYSVETQHAVSLQVYNILGQKVKTLVNEMKAPGSYAVTFDASQLASGVYFYRLTSGSFIQTKKMILLR